MPASKGAGNLVERVFHLDQLGELHDLSLRQRLRVNDLHKLQIVVQILIQTLVYGVSERGIVLLVCLDDLSLFPLEVLVHDRCRHLWLHFVDI